MRGDKIEGKPMRRRRWKGPPPKNMQNSEWIKHERSEKMKAVRIHAFGGPEVLSYEEVTLAEPGASQARVKNEVIGVNYTDVYQRSGQYPGQLPTTLGQEAAGVVDA